MIKTFRDREAERLFATGQSRRFQSCARRAFQELRMIDAASKLADLAALPGNRLEALKGDRKDQYSIRIKISIESASNVATAPLTTWKPQTITERRPTRMRKRGQRTPLHPGEILREQFMADFGVSINRLARDLRVPPTRIGEIVKERRAISPDTALDWRAISGPLPSSG